MNWRDFKNPTGGFKGLKGCKSPDTENLEPLKPLKPVQVKTKLSADEKIQHQSSDWRQFCDSHERALGGYCPLKRDRLRDPFTDCIGWKMKTGKEVIH